MSLTINPQHYFYRHQKGTVPSMNLLITVSFDGTWYLHNDPSLIFALNGENTPEIQGGSSQSVNIRLTNQINLWDQGMYELKLKAFNFNSTEEKTLIIYLILTDTEDDFIRPQKLHFEGIRNVVNAQEQKVFIATPDSGIQIHLPEFLQLVNHEMIGGGHIVTVKPVMQGATLLSNYTGSIDIDLPSEPQQKKVDVTYIIHAGFDESYTQPIHFTRSNKEIVFYQTTPEKSFLKFVALVKTYKTTGELHQEIRLDLDLPFIKYRAVLNLGLELESYFESIKNYQPLNSTLKGVYPPMQVSITAIEIKYSDYSILNQSLIPQQNYLIGRTPLAVEKNHAFWLNFRPSALRMVSNAALLSLALFKPAGEAIKNMMVRKNGDFIKNITPHSQTFGIMNGYFVSAQVDVASMGLKPGDELSFQYEGMHQVRKFLIRPTPKYSFMVAYETIWKTFELFEFTGSIKYGVDYVHDIFERLDNYINVSEKVSSENPQTMTINTGWIQKSEVYLINELILAKKSFLLPKSKFTLVVYTDEVETPISLVPIQSKLVNFDSEENMYQFDVEFLINKTYEDPIYPR